MTLTREISRYLVAGIVAALFALGIRILFSEAMSFGAATFCAQVAAMVFGYYLYRYYVWANTTRPIRATIAPFIAVNLTSLVVVMVVSVTVRMLLVNLIGMSEVIDTFSHATGIAFGAGLSLVGHRTFTFR